MRPPRARMTVRRLMVGVALVAGILWAGDAARLAIRSSRLRARADASERVERRLRDLLATPHDHAVEECNDLPCHDRDRARRLVAYHAAMTRQYRDAAAHPRAPIPPAPPRP